MSIAPGRRALITGGASGFELPLFDTAALYGFGANEDLVGRVLAPHRHRFTLASKCGLAIVPVDGKPTRVIDGRPDTLRRQCEDSLRRLKTDVIDLYYLHRLDRKVPIEDSVGEMSRMVERGHVRALGLSEMSATTLRRAHAVHPIAAMQTEYSLWSRNAEIAVLDACRELGTAFVAFSPVARGFLCGTVTDVNALDAKDMRRGMPRFKPEHFPANLAPAWILTCLGGDENQLSAALTESIAVSRWVRRSFDLRISKQCVGQRLALEPPTRLAKLEGLRGTVIIDDVTIRRIP